MSNHNDYHARVVCDSIADGVRLTTFEVTYPRFILAEHNTHKNQSKNSASSRAIPVEKRIRMVRENPFVPEAFSQNQRGMQADANLDFEADGKAREVWLRACNYAIECAEELAGLGVHKQHANRLLEPFAWHTVVCSASAWENFFNLRISRLAQPEICKAAKLMRAAMEASHPVELEVGQWHLPYIQPHELTGATLIDLGLWKEVEGPYALYRVLAKISSARCARVSYLTHDGMVDILKDLELHDRLFDARHMSPFEHPAQYVPKLVTTIGYNGQRRDHLDATLSGNFDPPWAQYRKTIPDEAVAPKEAP